MSHEAGWSSRAPSPSRRLPGHSFPIKSLAWSASDNWTIHLDNSFLSVRRESLFELWKEFPFLQLSYSFLLTWPQKPKAIKSAKQELSKEENFDQDQRTKINGWRKCHGNSWPRENNQPYVTITVRSQSCLTLRPHGLQHVRRPCPSLFPWVYLNSWQSSDAVQPSRPLSPLLSCPQSFPASRSLTMCWLFTSGWVLELQLQHQSFQWIFRVSCVLNKVVFLASTPCLSDSFIGLSCGEQSELGLSNKRTSPRIPLLLILAAKPQNDTRSHGSHQWKNSRATCPWMTVYNEAAP